MRLILDSSVLIAAERRGMNARQALAEVRARFPTDELALSVVTVLELNHGTHRANSSQRKDFHWEFLRELIATLTIYPVTTSIALNASQIDAESTANGV